MGLLPEDSRNAEETGRAMGELLAKCSALERLEFANTGLTGPDLEQLVQAMPPEFPRMKGAHFGGNRALLATEQGGRAMGLLLAKCPALEVLDLYSTGATAAALEELVRAAPEEFSRLKRMKFASNIERGVSLLASEAAGRAFGELLTKCPSLEALTITRCGLTAAALEHLAWAAPPELPLLTSFDFMCNDEMLVDGGRALGELFARFPALDFVCFQQTGLDQNVIALEQFVQALPPVLPGMKDMDFQEIEDLLATPAAGHAFAKLFAKCPALESCNFGSHCGITDEVRHLLREAWRGDENNLIT